MVSSSGVTKVGDGRPEKDELVCPLREGGATNFFPISELGNNFYVGAERGDKLKVHPAEQKL